MPKLIFARSPQGQEEEYRIHKLARSRYGPAHLILRTRIIVASWEGQRTPRSLTPLAVTPSGRLINFTRQFCPSHWAVLQGVVSASLIAS